MNITAVRIFPFETRESGGRVIALYRYNEPLEGKPIRSFTDYAMALIKSVLQVQDNEHLHSDDWQRTLYIDTLDVGATDFDISEEKKAALVRQGIAGVETYFTWFENPAETPVNRIQVRIHRTTGIHYEAGTGEASVGFVRGFGHWALGKLAKGRGAHDGWLLPGKAELLSGQAVHKEVACRIYKDL